MTSISVTRRSLLSGAGIVVAGGILGFAFGRRSSGGSSSAANGYGYTPPKSSTGSSLGRKLTELAKIPVGGGVILGGPRVVVTRDSSGNLHGFSATCTHQGCTVGSVRNGVIECPCHGSRFNANTGQVVRGPAVAPLPPVSVSVTGGVVYAH
jgi:Rieske Fe-S protein